MFFGRKKVREKKFIDYVLQDIPFGLDEMFALDQGLNDNTSNVQRHLIRRPTHRQFRTAVHNSWSDATVAAA